MPRYWKKEIPETPFYLPIGKAIQWDFVVDDLGWLATDDGYINAELIRARAARVGGVIEVSAEEYAEALKKKADSNSQPRQPGRPTIGPTSRRTRPQDVFPATTSVVGVMADGRAVSSFASPQKSEGLKVDRTFVKPRVGKAPPVND